MASNPNLSGLLDAEKEAQKIVIKAREYRTARVKEARTEAAKEIDALKAKRENEFRELDEKGKSEGNAGQEELDKQTQAELDSIKSQFDQKKDEVVKALLERLVDIDAKPHRNFKPKKQGGDENKDN